MRLKCILLAAVLLNAVKLDRGEYLDGSGCHESCSICNGGTENDCLATCPVYEEGGEPIPVIEGGGLYITDADLNDMFFMQSAVVEVFPQTTNDFNDIKLAATVPDGISEHYDSTEGVLFIDGEASVSIYQSILNSVTFSIENSEPDVKDRIICFTLFDGTQPSDPSCVSLKISSLNDNKPSFSFSPRSNLTYKENEEPIRLIQELNITDNDDPNVFPMQNASISVVDWCDSTDVILVDTSGTNIQQMTEGACITLSGSDTAENYSSVFLSARYNNTADEPDVQARTIVFALFDGENEATFNISINLQPMDDHQTKITINSSDVEVTEMEASEQFTLSDRVGLKLIDGDTNDDTYISELIIQINEPSQVEHLTFSSPTHPDITMMINEPSHIRLNGSSLIQNYQQALDSLRYGFQLSDDETPCPRARNLIFTVVGSSFGSFSDHLIVNVVPVNDFPPVLIVNDPVIFTENKHLKPLLGINITDKDELCMSDTLISAMLTLHDSTNTETLQFGNFTWLSRDLDVCTDLNPPPEPNTEQLNSNTAPLSYSNCSNGDDLLLKVVGMATIEQYLMLLESLVYFNDAEEPPQVDKTLMIFVNDSTFESDISTTIETVQVNDQPPMVFTDGTLFTHYENGSSTVMVGPSATIVDNDGQPEHKSVSDFCVKIENPQPEDVLYYLNDLTMTNYGENPSSGSDSEQGSGSGSGQGSSSNDVTTDSPLMQCLDVTSCADNFTDSSCFKFFLSAIRFSAAADEPNLNNRTVSFTAYDRTSGFQHTSYVTVTVSPINDKPHVLYLDGLLNSTHYFTNFTEGGDGVSLSRQLRIEDKDVGRKALTSATIIILHSESEDKILIDESIANANGLVVISNNSNEYIEIVGVATQSVYAELLASALYINRADEPTPPDSPENRVIVFTVSDEERTVSANTTVTLYPVNDPPQLPIVTVVYNETTQDPVYLFNSSVKIDDSDNTTIEYLTIEFMPSVDFLDNLTLPNISDANISVTQYGGELSPKTACYPAANNITTQKITLKGPATTESFDEILRNITFSNVCPGLKPEKRSIAFTLSDGIDVFTSWVYVDIARVEDPPICYFGQWPGVTTISTSYTENMSPVEIGSGFTLVDLDGPMEYTGVITVTMSLIRDVGEEMLGFNLSGNISLTNQTHPTGDDYYTTVYVLSNGASFAEYLEVLNSMTYINKALEPSIHLPRKVTISINNDEFVDCSVEVTVINIPDPPVVMIHDEIVSFTEDDSSPINVATDSVQIDISDEDNIFLYQARFNVTNTPSQYGSIIDTLFLPVNDQFTITGSGVGNGIITATAKTFSVYHETFVELIKSLQFRTNDKSTNITREISVVVEEYPLGEAGPSVPVVIPVRIIQKNDRPVLDGSPLITQDILRDFLPSEIVDNGFLPSHLIDATVISDIDSAFPPNPDIIGLAIFALDDGGIGHWQYWKEGDWVGIGAVNVSRCAPLFLRDDQRIRFLPQTTQDGGLVSFNYSVWDGTSEDVCEAGVVRTDSEVSISSAEASFEYTVHYDPPALNISIDKFSFTENGSSVAIFETLTIDGAISNAEIKISCGHCTEPLSGYEKITSHLETFKIEIEDPVTFKISPKHNQSVEAFQEFLRSIRYSNSFEEPEPFDRTISLYAFDGIGQSNTVSVTVSVQQINDNPPYFNLSDTIELKEGNAEIGLFIFSGLTVIKDDDIGLELTNLTVYFEEDNPCDFELLMLNFSTFSFPSNRSSSTADRSVSIEGPASTEDFNNAVNHIQYVNAEEEPNSCTSSLVFKISDENFTSMKKVTILFSPVNDNPPEVSLGQNIYEFKEEMNKKRKFDVHDFYPLNTISVTDDDVPDTPLVSGEVILLNPLDGDKEYIQLQERDIYNPLNFTAFTVLQNNTHLTINSTGEEGLSTIFLQENLRKVTYYNSDSNPSTTQRVISVTVSDELDIGVTKTVPVHVYINITPYNNPPEVLLHQQLINYVGKLLGAVTVAPNADVFDPENDNLTGLIITLTGNFSISSNETLTVNRSLIPLGVEITENVSSSDLSRFGDDLIHLFSLKLYGEASGKDYEKVLRSLTYTNNDDSPDQFGTRTLYVLPIGIEEETGLKDLVQVSYNEVNTPPVVDLNGDDASGRNINVTFTEDSGTPVLLSVNAAITDSSPQGNLSSVTVKLEPHLDGGYESLLVTVPDDIEIIWNTPNVSFSLNGKPTAALHSFTQALRSLSYINFANEPNTSKRYVYITAHDGGLDSSTVVASIRIISVNDKPALTLGATVNLTYVENSSPLGIFVQPVLKDSDSDVFTNLIVMEVAVFPGDVISSSLFEFDRNGTYYTFSSNGTSKEVMMDFIRSITFSSSLGEPAIGERRYCIAVSDGMLWSNLACVTIRLIPVNDNLPYFTMELYKANVTEEKPDTSLLQLMVMDEDSTNSEPVYELKIIAGDACHDQPLMPCKFQIDSDRVLRVTNNPPDREQKSNYTLTVAVSEDGFISSTTAMVEVDVLDINDNAPVFSGPLNVSVEEHSPIGTPVLALSATDEDIGQNANVSFVLKTLNTPFTIDHQTNYIIIANSNELDRERKDTYELQIEAYNPYDIKGPNSTANVSIKVTDKNDNVPFVPDLNITVMEDFTPNDGFLDPIDDIIGSGSQEIPKRYITTITANDIDAIMSPNSVVKYSIIKGDDNVFEIDQNTGDIFAKELLDREIRETYSLVIGLEDSGVPPLSSNVTLLITIADMNDNPPIFTMSHYKGMVFEGESDMFSLLVTANDADKGLNGTVVYQLQEESDLFYIDETTGEIRSNGTFDREMQASYTLVVEAYDLGSPSLSISALVTINVTDINDHPPMITLVTLNETIIEHSPIGTVVAVFTINDNDEPSNADSELTLIGGDGKFAVSQVGVVTVANDIDHETLTGGPIFILSLQAENLAEPKLSETYNFSVEILNINDNAPIVVFATGEVSFAEGSDFAISLDVGITIEDPDGRNFTNIYDAKVELLDINTQEPSYPFVPTTDDNPSYCPLELKEEKAIACGLSNGGTVMIPSNINAFNSLQYDDSTLVFDGSQQQYAIEKKSLMEVKEGDDISIMMWIWYTPTPGSSTIFANVRDTGVITYGAVCHNGTDMEFLYQAAGTQKSHTFSGACEMLTNQWHHLSIVIDSLDGTQVSLFIEGVLFSTAPIDQPEDEFNDKLFLGARPISGDSAPTRDFFTGRLHKVIMSTSVVQEPNINCITGCGIYLYSSQLSPAIPYSYNYSKHQLFAEGIRDVGVYEDFLNSLVFVIAFSEPRQLSYNFNYTVTDGGFNCIPVTLNITIEPSNDGDPVLNLNGASGQDFSAVYVEEQGPVEIVNSTSLSVVDVDLLPYPYEIMATITDPVQPSSEEVLSVSGLPAGMTMSYSDYVLSVKGTFTIDTFETVLRTLTYNNLADEPDGATRTVSVLVKDPLLGPRISNTAHSSISILFVNDPISFTFEQVATDYYEGDGSVAILKDTVLEDSDNDTLLSVIISFNPLDGNAETIGVDTTFTNISHIFTTTVGIATLTLEGQETLGVYEDVIDSLTYENSNDNNITEGNRVFRFTFFDGVAYSDVENATLFVHGVNDPPVVDINGNFDGNSIEKDFIEDDGMEMIRITTDMLTITDVDSHSLISASVTFASRPDAQEEYITITPDLPFSVNDTGTLVISIEPSSSGTATLAEFEEVLKTLQYTNTAEEPVPGVRTLNLTVNDGQASSPPATITVTIVATNDPPYLDLDTSSNGTGFSTTYVENGPAVEISSENVQISDNDAGSFVSHILVVMKNPKDGSNEAILVASYLDIIVPPPVTDGGKLVYNITNSNGTQSSAVSIIMSLQYNNTNTEPTPGVREIDISVHDGNSYSNMARVNVTVDVVNDLSPVFNPLGVVLVPENQPPSLEVVKVIAEDGDSGVPGTVSYSLTKAYPAVGLERFQIDIQSGIISTVIELDRENVSHYILTVVAADGGVPSKTDETNVSIVVLDENDNKPLFDEDVYYAEVSELAELGSVVATAVAVDKDNPSQPPFFSEQGVSNLFNVMIGGDITIAAPLDADVPDPEYNITVLAEDPIGGGFDTAMFIITVLEENDNSPKFDMDSYEGSIPENLNGVIVMAVFASDEDFGSDGEVGYYFANESTYKDFTIDESTGLITTNRLLDREEQEVYHFTVLAVDGGSPPRNSTAAVTITLLDINDNSPTFSQTSFNISIPEGGFRTLRVSGVTDPDKGENGTIQFSINAENIEFDMLNVGSATDLLIDATEIDYETTKTIIGSVIATDNGPEPLNTSIPLTIFIEDVNDNRPMFIGGPFAGQVPEGALNYFVTSVAATDLDTGSNGVVKFKLGGYKSDFTVNETSGEIRTSQGLDFEGQCFIKLPVIAFDLGIPPLSSTATVDITVTGSNDEPPSFNQSFYTGSVIESSGFSGEVFVTQVFAFDDDRSVCEQNGVGSGDDSLTELTDVTYVLLNHNDKFRIDPVSGVIFAIVNFDREVTPEFTLIVSATDGSSLSSNVSIIVTIEDINDKEPKFPQDSYGVMVSESLSVGSSIFQVVATDLDTLDNGKLTYSIPGGIELFEINKTTGVIYLLKKVDFETEIVMHTFFVVVRDTIDQLDVTQVTVTITDANDHPPSIDTSSKTLTFMEGQVSLMPFTEINISDIDTIKYLSSAVITLYSPETAVNANYDCYCSDTSNASSCSEGCQEFLQIAQSAFPGNTSVSNNGSILTLSGYFSYEVYEKAIESVQYINILSNPSFDERNVSVTVNEGGLPSNTLTNVIEMVVLNRFSPVLDLNGLAEEGIDYAVSFTESGSAVLVVSESVSITDNDVSVASPVVTMLEVWIDNPLDGSDEVLRLTPGFSVPAGLTLSVSQHSLTITGTASNESYITVLKKVEYINHADEPNPAQRQINFKVTEYHLSSQTATTNVTILTLNDHPPSILLNPPLSSYTVEYRETVGMLQIASENVQISDEDSTEEPLLMMRVHMVSQVGQFDQLSFVGMNTSDSISVQQLSQASLLFEGTGSYMEYEEILRSIYYSYSAEEFTESNASMPHKLVIVEISDKKETFSSVTQLTLIPENDQQPKLTNETYIVKISENATVGTSIIQLSASDGDTISESKPKFSISSGNDDGLFSINGSTGVVTLAQELDFEKNKVHMLTVQVEDLLYDTGSDPPSNASIEIVIGDVNDHAPQFNQSSYNATIGEGAPIGTVVLQVGATDFDSSIHSQLIFGIIGTTDFSIDQNGRIRTTIVLDRESVAAYYFNVSVRNPGSFTQDFAEVFVGVLDLDDNLPLLVLSPDSVTLTEPSIVTALSHSLSITDPDPVPSLDMANVSIISGPGTLFVTENISGLVLEGNNTQTLTVTGTQSLSVYETLLRSIQYMDPADEPIPVERRVVYKVTSGESSTLGSLTVMVETINDHVPLVLLSNGSSMLNVEFTEDGDAILLAGDDLSITDADSGENTISSAVIELLTPLDGDDEVLKVNVSNGIVLDPQSTASRLVITGVGSLTDYETILRTVTYVNTAEEPNGQTREVTFIVNDGVFNSTPAVTYISIALANDPPVLTLEPNSIDTHIVYHEGQPHPLILAPQLEIEDVDSELLTSAVVFIREAGSEESLNISKALPQLTVSPQSNGQLILNAASGKSIEVFEDALRSVTYYTSRNTPYPTPREVIFVVSDDRSAQSFPATARVTFNSSDDTPIIDLNGPMVPGLNFTVTYNEDTEDPVKIVSSNVSIIDVDTDVVTNLTVTILTTYPGDKFTLPEISGLSKTINYPVFTYSGVQSPELYEELLRSFSFNNTLEEHSNEDRHVLFQVFTPVSVNGHSAGSNMAETTIHISSTNDHVPVFDQDVYNGFVYENTNPGAEVGIVVMATDRDIPSNTNILYSIDGGSSLFTIDSMSGIVTTLQPLDAELLPPAITFVVVAEDSVAGVVHTATATVNITIGDLNDNQPEFGFTQHFVDINENEPIGFLVYVLNASDRDRTSEHSEVKYSIGIDTGSGLGLDELEPLDLPFVLDELSGQIMVSGNIDSEMQTNFTIPVVASDGVFLTEATIIVNVVDVNDNSPYFVNQPYLTEVPEGTELGMHVLTVSAVDHDMGSNAIIAYSIEGTALFTINETTGKIYVAGPLDYEAYTNVVFTVVASDGSFSSSAQVNVTILNKNDNKPVFTESSYHFSYPENVQFKITAVDATDADGDVLTFSITSSCKRGLIVDPTNGEISSTEPLDRELQSQCDFTATVSDGVTDVVVPIRLTVLDENDNSPVFSNQVYQLTIPEVLPVGSMVLNVSASDADEGKNKDLIYSIIEETSVFNISSSTGAIYLTSPVDFESITMYNLTVEARDGGDVPLTGTARVEITVDNTNDESPVLFLSETSISYTENSGSVLLASNIQVMDPDNKPLVSARIALVHKECPEEYENQEVQCIEGHDCFVACGEALSVESGTLGSIIHISHQREGNHLYLNLTGEASTSQYQSVLSSLRYLNAIDEPIPGETRVEIVIKDGNSESNVLAINITVTLVDNYCAVVSSSSADLLFVEGSDNLNIGIAAGLMITDADRLPHKTISELRVVGEGFVDGNESIQFNSSVPSLTVSQADSDSTTGLIVTGTSNIEAYISLLQTLLYSNQQAEPTSGTRKIRFTPVSDSFNCSSLELSLNVVLVNDHPPEITFEQSTALSYLEESGPLFLISTAGLQLSDEDSTFPLKRATIQLSGNQDDIELLNLSINPVPENVNISNDETSVTIEGEASIETYNSLLNSVYYINAATEPAPGIRTVNITVDDGSFKTTASLTINVLLSNDNDLSLSCDSKPAVFVEGSETPIILSPSLSLSDLDANQQITRATVTIINPQEGDSLSVEASSELVVVNNGTHIDITGESSTSDYQSLLLSIAFLNTASEPEAAQRVVSIIVYQSSSSVSCSVPVSIQLINDNKPVVDLSGPSDSSINRTTTISYNYLSPTSVAVASENATIIDADADSVVSGFDVNIILARSGDRLIINPDICASTSESLCYINLPAGDEPFSCWCGGNPSNSADLSVEVAPTSVAISQSGNLSNVQMQLALRKLVYFEHSMSPAPESSYIAEMIVTVSDGELTSDPATTTVMVEYVNSAPIVFIDQDQTMTGKAVMSDGQTTLTLAENMLISDDAGALSQVSVHLTNPVHAEAENIFLTIPANSNIQLDDSSNSTYLLLTGETNTSSYSSVLRTLQFGYSRMGSLLEQQPDINNRIIAVTATDSQGAKGPTSTITVTFNRLCSVWSADSVIKVPAALSLEQLGICTSVSGHHIRISGDEISSLKPLQDLEAVDTLSLVDIPNLQTLKGLENLASFSELILDDVDGLTTMEHLSSNLPSDHRVEIQSFAVQNCDALENIEGLRIVENITNLIQIQNCGNLGNITGMRNLLFVGTMFLIRLPSTDILNFHSLFEASDLWIYNNPSLQSITGFQSLRKLEMMNIIINPNLVSIDGLSGLLKVGSVRMFGNPKLCYIGTETPSAQYWQNLNAETLGDFVTASCLNRMCSDNPCLNSAQCMDGSDSFSCDCTDSFEGSVCQFINECETSSPCQNGGTCSTNINAVSVHQYTCSCLNGTSGFDCELLD